MSNAFTAALAYLTDHLASFFLAEPVVYFTGFFMLVLVIGLTARLIRGDFTRGGK